MFKVNSKLLPIKAHYFFFLAAMGPILPFLPLIGKQLGISEIVMGIINALLPLLFLVAKPLFGFLIDYFQEKRKLIFILLLAVTSILYALLGLIPNENKYHIQCNDLTLCSNNNSLTECLWVCGNNERNVSVDLSTFCASSNFSCQGIKPECTLDCSDSLGNLYFGLSFWMFVILMSLGTIGFNVSNSVSDAICFDCLGEGNEMKYGQQRVWGTIGFGLTALLGGYFIDFISKGEKLKNYTPAYLLTVGCMVLDVFCSYKLILPPLPKSANILGEVGSLMIQPHIATFLVFATLVGVCDSAMIYFLLWYLEDLAEKTDQLDNIKLLEGLTVAAETLFGEVVFFYLSGKVLSKLGYGHCLTICFGFYALRLGLVSCISSPWWILPIEMFLQGPTYAMTYTTVVAYASAVSPPGTSGTMQGLVAGMDDGFGYAIGSFCGGVLYRIYGGGMMFRVFSILAAFSSVAHGILYIKFFKNSIDNPRAPSKPTPAMYELSPLKSVKSSDDLQNKENI